MKKIIYFLLIFAVSTQIFAQKLNIPIPNNAAVKVGSLKNGLKYYILKNSEPKNRMELRLVVNAGSILETDAQQGLAHFLEHMNFNGTKNFPKNELVNFLQKSGMKFGADLNASTSFDETIYQLQVPTDSAKLFERAFQILADWSNNATLDTAEINKERGIVLEEERARGKNAQARIQQKIFPILFNHSRYANRLPIGKTEIIKTFAAEELIKFYRDWYRPDLMAVVAVGDFDITQVESLIKEKFSTIKSAKNVAKRTKYQIPASVGTETYQILDKEVPQSTFQMFTRLPREKTRTQADYRTDITENLYNQMIGNRLQEASKKPNAPFVFAIMGYGEFLAGLDVFQMVVLPKNASGMEAAIKAIIDEQERLHRFGFTKGELERAKKEYMVGVEKGFKEKDKTKSAVFVNALVQNYLQDAAFTDATFRYEFAKKHIESISLEEVNVISKKVIKTDNRVGLIVGSEKDKLPNKEKLKELIAYKNPDLKPYEDEAVLTPILEKIPAGTKIISEKKIEEMGLTELIFGNGAKVALKPTTFKNDQILFSASSKGGTSLYSDTDYFSADVASIIVSQGGVSELSDTQLEKTLAGKVAQVYTYIGELSEGLGGSTTPKDLETALQLMYAYATKPRRDEEVINNFLKNEKELLTNSIKTLTPDKVFDDTLSAVLYQNHLRRTANKPEDIDKINIDRSFEIYKERFADFSDFTFVFVGSFEVEKIKPLLEKYIGGLPSTMRQESFKNLGINKIKGKVEKNIYKGFEDKARVSLQFNGDFAYSEEEFINLDALAEVLDIKLTEKLREEASGVYSPSINSSYEKLPKANYNLTITFGCSPANVEKLVQMTLEEIEKIKISGPEKVDVEKVIAEEKRKVELQVKENSFWNTYLLNQYADGEDLNFINRYQSQLIDKISVESIQKAAKQFCAENIAKFTLLPERK